MFKLSNRFLVFSLFVTLFFCGTYALVHQSIPLRDVEVLTLHNGQMTTGRRSAPVPQLNCVGGRARAQAHRVKTVQCYNRGFDGLDVNWECQAELDKDIRLGKTEVYCEGFENPDDPNILAGSCGLEYELEYTGAPRPRVFDRAPRHTHIDTEMNDVFTFLITLFWLAIVFILIASLIRCLCFSGTTHVVSGGTPVVTHTSGGFWDGWFWGSMFSSRPSTHVTRTTYRSGGSSYGSSLGSAWGSSSSGSSGSSHTSTSYASTKRR